MRISVVGLGHVGQACVALLSRLGWGNLDIEVLDPAEQVRGAFHDLVDAAAAAAGSAHWLQLNSYSTSVDADVVIFTAGAQQAREASRNAVAAENRAMVRHILSQLTLTEKKTSMIMVTNPVELTTRAAMHAAAPGTTVVGTGTFLDSVRLRRELIRALDRKDITAVALGEHGAGMVPIWSQCRAGDTPIRDLLDDGTLERIRANTVRAAYRIRASQPATRYGVAACVVEIVRALFGEQELWVPLSVGMTPEWAEALNVTPAVVSLPVRVSRGGFEVQPPTLLDAERAALAEVARRLASAQSVEPALPFGP